ncbi:hypothetical protein HMI54_000808, partial [Coelomomyces lativittatus]
MRKAKVFAGSSHEELASLIVEKLGIPASPLLTTRHSNREASVELGLSVRNQDVFIIQSGSSTINDHLMELLMTINSCRISDAARITAILPYFPYSKQSKKKLSRGCIPAKMVANMLAVAGVDHIITLDLHHDQMQGFFNRPIDNLLAEPTFCKYIQEHFPDEYMTGVVVSKNPGGVKRVTSMADRLKIDFALMHKDHLSTLAATTTTTTTTTPTNKDRTSSPLLETSDSLEQPTPPTTNFDASIVPIADSLGSIHVVEVIHSDYSHNGLQLVGEVTNRICFVLDDIIDKPDSFISAAELLCKKGATQVILLATHGILNPGTLEKFEMCDAISQ